MIGPKEAGTEKAFNVRNWWTVVQNRVETETEEDQSTLSNSSENFKFQLNNFLIKRENLM